MSLKVTLKLSGYRKLYKNHFNLIKPLQHLEQFFENENIFDIFDECLAIQHFLMLRKKMISLRLQPIEMFLPSGTGNKRGGMPILGKVTYGNPGLQSRNIKYDTFHQKKILHITKKFPHGFS